MNTKNRPLSPHLHIYRPQLTSMLSIMHRLTGIALMGIAVALVSWLVFGAYGAPCYTHFMIWSTHPVARIIGFLGVYAFFYHLLNGIRHLFWDMGWGLDLPTTYQTGWLVVVLSTTVTFLYCLFI